MLLIDISGMVLNLSIKYSLTKYSICGVRVSQKYLQYNTTEALLNFVMVMFMFTIQPPPDDLCAVYKCSDSYTQKNIPNKIWENKLVQYKRRF